MPPSPPLPAVTEKKNRDKLPHLTRAAAEYRIERAMDKAGLAYSIAAEIHELEKNPVDAAENFYNAAKAYGSLGKLEEADSMFSRTMDVYEELKLPNRVSATSQEQARKSRFVDGWAVVCEWGMRIGVERESGVTYGSVLPPPSPHSRPTFGTSRWPPCRDVPGGAERR